MRRALLPVFLGLLCVSLSGCGDSSEDGWTDTSADWSRSGEPAPLSSGNFYLAAAGDPEDFLYRGARREDGTRDGDQEAIIDSLDRQGVNGIYFQIIRSNGGDGEADHNPFVGNDPEKGLNLAVLDQWEKWFRGMRDVGIHILLFLYDDSATIWDTGDEVDAAEREFIHAIIDRFEGMPNIIWAVAEEYSEAFSPSRASAIAVEIAAADDFDHPIAIHKRSGTEFREFARDPNINVFAIQLKDTAPVAINDAVTEAWSRAMGLYGLIMSEAPEWGIGLEAQRKAWASAFGGAHVMVYDLPFERPDGHDLKYLSHLRGFSERFGLIEAVPYPRIAIKGSLFAMKGADGSYYVYGSGELGLSGVRSGPYTITVFDPANGRVITDSVIVTGNEWSYRAPPEYNADVAVALSPEGNKLPGATAFPIDEWDVTRTAESSVDYPALAAIAKEKGGDGCIVMGGRMIYHWGDIETRREWASAAKSILATLTGLGIQTGVIDSIDQPIVEYGWRLRGADRDITFRHLINMTSGYARAEPPGEAWAYNDFGPTILGKTLDMAFGVELDGVFREWLRPLNFQDNPGLDSRRGYGLKASVRDACRIGLLWLHEGRWNDQVLLDSRIFHSLVAPAVPRTMKRTAGWSWNYRFIRSFGGDSDMIDYGPGIYGSMFWFNEVVPQNGLPNWPGLPRDAFQANGHGGDKHITVIPSMDLVLVGHQSNRRDRPFEPGNPDSPMNVYLSELVRAVDR